MVIQLAAQTFPALGLPNWTVRLLILVLLIACPVGVILIWAFRATSDPGATSNSRTWPIIVLVLLPIVSVIGYSFSSARHLEPQALFLILFMSALLYVPSALAAVGMWFGRRWAWWLQLVLLCLNLFVFPLGTIIAGVAVLFLLWIRSAYFQRSSAQPAI